jgi:hypothetical protein
MGNKTSTTKQYQTNEEPTSFSIEDEIRISNEMADLKDTATLDEYLKEFYKITSLIYDNIDDETYPVSDNDDIVVADDDKFKGLCLLLSEFRDYANLYESDQEFLLNNLYLFIVLHMFYESNNNGKDLAIFSNILRIMVCIRWWYWHPTLNADLSIIQDVDYASSKPADNTPRAFSDPYTFINKLQKNHKALEHVLVSGNYAELQEALTDFLQQFETKTITQKGLFSEYIHDIVSDLKKPLTPETPTKLETNQYLQNQNTFNLSSSYENLPILPPVAGGSPVVDIATLKTWIKECKEIDKDHAKQCRKLLKNANMQTARDVRRSLWKYRTSYDSAGKLYNQLCKYINKK